MALAMMPRRRSVKHRPRDPVLDRFMPVWDAGHHYAARVEAPPEVAMGTALAQDYMAPPLVRALVWVRALMLGRRPLPSPPSRGILADMQAIGWGVLADYPDVIVMGAVTRPWEPNPTFRAVDPSAFAGFREPGLVKIAWALRVEPDGPRRSVVHIETRAVATDAAARRRFARYWAFVARGTSLIRWALLASIRRAVASRRRALTPAPSGTTTSTRRHRAGRWRRRSARSSRTTMPGRP